jgi:hypothetical protein
MTVPARLKSGSLLKLTHAKDSTVFLKEKATIEQQMYD